MMNEAKAEKILSLLVELYARQNNVKVTYHIEKRNVEQKQPRKHPHN